VKTSGQLPDGTRLRLTDDGEGWFRGVRELAGSIHGRVRDAGDASPWYVLQLDGPVEIQETGHNTVSGFRLVRYSVLLTRSRIVGE
jgi:hypothetical protein